MNSEPRLLEPDLFEPDGLTGAVLAVEGIRDAAVLLNGPTGCKFYHGAVAEGQMPRESSYDPLKFLDEFYFGQPRVPVTYLDGNDYVFGASEKLRRILPVVASKGHSLIAAVNTPGAALIGDDLDRSVRSANLQVPCVTIETTGYSGTFEEGFQEALIRTLETLKPSGSRETGPCIQGPCVNLIGVSIEEKYWEGNNEELARLLSLCGIEVNTVLSAGSTVDELRNLPCARLNVMVREEFGNNLADWCAKNFGLETLRPCSGAPVGFDQTERWVREICDAVGASFDSALRDIDEARTRAVMHIKQFNSLTGLPKGATFAVRERPSFALPLSVWLYEYLGMTPAAISPVGLYTFLHDEFEEMLRGIGCEGAWKNRGVETADVVFADGVTVARVEESTGRKGGIEISLPSRDRVDIVPKSVYGPRGALHLLEWIINALVDLR